MTNLPAPRHNAIVRAYEGMADEVPHISPDAVRALMLAAEAAARTLPQGRRDGLLIATMFDGCMRVSEALQLAPNALIRTPTGWQGDFTGKGGRRAVIAFSASLVAQLQSYAYETQLKPSERFWPFTRQMAHYITKRAFERAGVRKPPGVGHDHVLRHSGALARLAMTGNPKALQDQLRHKSAAMTLRYMKTLSHKESLEIQKGVDFGW